MLLILMAAAALQSNSFEGSDLRALFSAADIPDFLPVESDRSVGFRLTVRPDGQVQSCDIEYSSGFERLDYYTCKLVKRRAKVGPSVGETGTPVYSVYRTTVRWVVTNFAKPGPPPNLADLTLTVNQLPSGHNSPLSVGIKFYVDAAGHASSCSGLAPSQPLTPEEKKLVVIACNQFLASYKPIAAKDEQNHSVPSVQNACVVFERK